MNEATEDRRSRLGSAGWIVVLLGSALLTFQGVAWYVTGPGTALDNIAERTPLRPEAFRDGGAFDVITIVTRTQAVYGAALGLLSLLVAWRGFRNGSSWAWWASWVFIAAVAFVGLSFLSVGGAGVGVVYLVLAAMIGAGLLLARRSVRTNSGAVA